jgi:hypothetical protein
MGELDLSQISMNESSVDQLSQGAAVGMRKTAP